MGSKFSPVIIVVLIAVVIAIGLFIFSIVTGDTQTEQPQEQVSGETATKPVINLSKQMDDEENPQKVTITVKATTTDEGGIKEIVLPTGEAIPGDTATFEVDENGSYEFFARCENGESDSLSIDVTEIAEISADNPYVPEGFSVINDSVEEGFVIEDGDGNQYVWIPVASGKLERENALNPNYEESGGDATALVNSVSQYYGFYMGRVEASQFEKDGETVAASMVGKVPWTNISYLDAIDYAEKSAEAFGYTDCYTSIINSYAWDTALKWIDQTYENYSSSTNYGNYSGTIYPTGTTEQDIVNNICDMAGNVREWSTEIYKEIGDDSSKNKKDDEENLIKRVVRSGGASLKRTPSSNIGYAENSVNPYWGFRLVLYKHVN
mgnify:FL=1